MQPRPDEPILTVSDLNREARELLESGLPGLWVEGEISGFIHHGSGHMYFTLKDDRAEVRCAMFRGANRHLGFRLVFPAWQRQCCRGGAGCVEIHTQHRF